MTLHALTLERRRSEALDRIASECARRTDARLSHVGCLYCRYMAEHDSAQQAEYRGVHGSLASFLLDWDHTLGVKRGGP